MVGLQVELPVGDNPKPNNASTHCKKIRDCRAQA
jgi:hypothetical protein